MDLTKLPDFKNKITEFGSNWGNHNGVETQEFLESMLQSRFGAIRKYPGEGGKRTYRFFSDEASADKYEADTTANAALCLGSLEIQASEVSVDDRYMLKDDAYTKTEADGKFAAKTEVTSIAQQAAAAHAYSKAESDSRFASAETVSSMETQVSELDSTVTAQDTRITTLETTPDGMPIVQQTEAVVSIQPDVLNVWGEMASLTIDFAAGSEGYAHEYCMEFISGATATTLSLPESVKFPDEPTIEPNMRYQISVVNNIGLIAGVPFELGDAELASPNEPIGIGVLLKNGKKIDYAKMSETSSFQKEQVEGITLEKEGRSYIIAPTQIQCYFCNGNQTCYDATCISGTSAANSLLNGKENTATLRASLTADSGWAVNQVFNTIVNGKNCWLPSLGELSLIWRYKTEVDALLAMCQCETLSKSNYWSSALASRVDADGNDVLDVNSEAYLNAVFGIYQSGDLDGFNVQGLYYALPITDYTEGGAA